MYLDQQETGELKVFALAVWAIDRWWFNTICLPNYQLIRQIILTIWSQIYIYKLAKQLTAIQSSRLNLKSHMVFFVEFFITAYHISHSIGFLCFTKYIWLLFRCSLFNLDNLLLYKLAVQPRAENLALLSYRDNYCKFYLFWLHKKNFSLGREWRIFTLVLLARL